MTANDKPRDAEEAVLPRPHPGTVCPHSQLARQCPLCEAAAEIKELRAHLSPKPIAYGLSIPHAESWSGLMDYIVRQRQWSEQTFGPGLRTEGLCKHIQKECQEIRAQPGDLGEWIDVIILALDGAWRTGAPADRIIHALLEKQAKNRSRRWPPPGPQDEPNEHIREGEAEEETTP